MDTRLTLEAVLQHPKGLELFEAFTESEFSSSELLYWKEVEHFRRKCGERKEESESQERKREESISRILDAELTDLAMHIYDKYVKEGADEQVTLASHMAQSITNAVKSGHLTSDMFSESHDFIFHVELRDALYRFWRSPYYQELVYYLLNDLDKKLGFPKDKTELDTNEHLDAIISNEIGFYYLDLYMKQNNNDLLTKFEFDLKMFKRLSLSSQKDINNEARRLSKLYFHPSSNRPLNSLPALQETSVLHKASNLDMTQPNKHMFDELEQSILRLVRTKIFPQFLESDSYAELMRQMKRSRESQAPKVPRPNVSNRRDAERVFGVQREPTKAVKQKRCCIF